MAVGSICIMEPYSDLFAVYDDCRFCVLGRLCVANARANE